MKSFWDSNPSGSQGSYIEAYNQRYDNEPWILYELKKSHPICKIILKLDVAKELIVWF